MHVQNIGFVGGGRITKIFLQAFENKGITFDKIVFSEPNNIVLEKLKGQFPSIVVADELSAFEDCAIVFLATHPPIVLEMLEKLKPYLKVESILVSLAPKITIGKMKAILCNYVNIVRVNPSATGVINQGLNPTAFAEGMSDEKKSELLELLNVLGKATVVSEPKIEAYAVISAMGSTYFLFQLKHLYDLAVSYGMENGEAKDVITEMMKGTVNIMPPIVNTEIRGS